MKKTLIDQEAKTMKTPTAIEVMESPFAHDHLKETLQLFLSKDPVDAVNDAEILLVILKTRVNAIANEQKA